MDDRTKGEERWRIGQGRGEVEVRTRGEMEDRTRERRGGG